MVLSKLDTLTMESKIKYFNTNTNRDLGDNSLSSKMNKPFKKENPGNVLLIPIDFHISVHLYFPFLESGII